MLNITFQHVCVCVYLHGVVCVLVIENDSLLDELVVSLQFVDVGFVVDDVLLIILQVVHLFLQRASNVHRHMADFLKTQTHTPMQMILNPFTLSHF